MSEEQNMPEEGTTDDKPYTTEEINASEVPVINAELYTINEQPSTENMEVHKHPHHVTHKKKWGEYLLEFFMLFLAVFLGFVAENIREENVEGKKEKQYMQYLIEDIDKDTAALHKSIHTCQFAINYLDSAISILTAEHITDSSTAKLYSLNLKYLGDLSIAFTDRTEAQLKNAGAMRLIKRNEVLTHLFNYWSQAENLKALSSLVYDLRYKARDLSYQLFNVKYYLQNSDGSPLITDKPVLMTKEFKIITELANRLSHIKNLLQNVYVPLQKEELAEAEALRVNIKKSYRLQNE